MLQKLPGIAKVTATMAIVCALGSVAQAGSLKWETDYDKARKQAQTEGKPMLAMFTASWCGPCQRMKSSTLSDSRVERQLEEHFIPVMIDTDANPRLTRKFGVTAMPTIAVIDPVSEDAEKSRGYQGTSEFLSFMDRNKMDIQLASASMPALEKGNGEALTNYCLVSAVEDGKLVIGEKDITATHEGFVVRFASKENKKQFEANPETYWPQIAGNCPVHLAETGKLVRGEVRWVIKYENQLYMCDSESHADQFLKSPAKFIDAVRTRLASAATEGVRR